MLRIPRLSSYVVDHDVGFAPNPFHGVCTLAACKPRIRKHAVVGDYLLGTGGAANRLQGRIIYVARVGEITSFDEYWNDDRFTRKKPVIAGSQMLQYGDNIYHHADDGSGNWVQEDSFHSKEDGSPDPKNMQRDTGYTDRVLIADWFIYFGGNGPNVPTEFQDFVHKGIGHHHVNNEERIQAFVEWVNSIGEPGAVDIPADWN